jgi:hypothetical protein
VLFPKKLIKMDQNGSCIHLPIFGFRWYFSIHSPPVFLSFGSLALLTRGLSQKKRVLLQGLLLLGHRQQQRPEEVSFWIRANMDLPSCTSSAWDPTWMNKNIEDDF